MWVLTDPLYPGGTYYLGAVFLARANDTSVVRGGARKSPRSRTLAWMNHDATRRARISAGGATAALLLLPEFGTALS